MQNFQCDFDFDHQAMATNKSFCQNIVSLKQDKLNRYKQKISQKETIIIQNEQLQNKNIRPNEIVQPINTKKQVIKKKSDVKIQNIQKSLKVNGINLVIQYVSQCSYIFNKRPDVIASFIVNSSVKWPGNQILKTNQKIKKSLQNQLKSKNQFIDFQIQNTNSIVIFNNITQKQQIPRSLKRLVNMMRDQQFTLIYISAAFGIKTCSQYQQVSIALSELIKEFKLSINKPSKIVFCCNQTNYLQTIKAFSDKEDQLFLQKEIHLE